MAQTESPTTQGYGEIGKMMSGEAATAFAQVVGIANTCTANEAQTYAGIDKIAANGFQIVNATTVASYQTTVANDTTQVHHVFTATGTQIVKGFMVANQDGDVAFGLCCFASDVNAETNDTLTVDLKSQFKLGA